MKKRFVSLVALAVFLYSLLLAAAAGPETMYSNMNPNKVKNSPPSLRVLNLKADSSPIRVSQLSTYHWNNGRGASPGTISIWENGKQLGAWKAEGRSGSGANNVYWVVYPNITLWPGHKYEVHDSDIATWSWNEASGNCGMFELQGTYMAQAPKTKKNNAKPKAQPAASSKGWALVDIKTIQNLSDHKLSHLKEFRHTESDGYLRYHIAGVMDGTDSSLVEASCTLPPSSISPGQKVVLELELAMDCRFYCNNGYSELAKLVCNVDPSRDKSTYSSTAWRFENVIPDGPYQARVFSCNDGREPIVRQNKIKVFYRFPEKKDGGLSIYCIVHAPCGSFMTEFRYE